MALKLFKRGEKAPKEPKAPKELSPKRSFFKRVPKKEEIVEEPVKVIEEDKLPQDIEPVKVSAPPANPDPITEEEGDVNTVETAPEEPIVEEADNAATTEEVVEAPVAENKDMTLEESEKQSKFTCCDGEVLKNLQAAVGL